MSNTLITIDNLGKKYIINQYQQKSYVALRDVIADKFNCLGRKIFNINNETSKHSSDEFWALRNISFEVKDGDRLGIIGRNGAGKSTLLKLLSRITEPTEGKVRLRGRVASLLEVGTGFHPELSGRENIFLNGAILGMGKKEIKRKFDEIVAFSEVETFLDTPVKKYSSGMYVRLAFAVAAHLEPEILIIDEVLAVGDAQFQKKCLGKMEDVSEKEGRTILFVSHNMAAVEKLCNRGMLIDHGNIKFIGSPGEAITHYITSSAGNTLSELRERSDRQGSGQVKIVGIEFKDVHGHTLDVACSGQDVDIFLHYESSANINKYAINVGITFKTQLDAPVFLHTSTLNQVTYNNLPESGTFICRLLRLPLPASTYKIGYGLVQNLSGETIDSIKDAAELTVVEGDYYGSGLLPPVSHGVCLVDAEWHLL